MKIIVNQKAEARIPTPQKAVKKVLEVLETEEKIPLKKKKKQEIKQINTI